MKNLNNLDTFYFNIKKIQGFQRGANRIQSKYRRMQTEDSYILATFPSFRISESTIIM